MNICNGVGQMSDSEDSSFENQSNSVFDSNSELDQQHADQDIDELWDFLNLNPQTPQMTHLDKSGLFDNILECLDRIQNDLSSEGINSEPNQEHNFDLRLS